MRVAMVVEQCWQPVPGGSGTYVARLTEALAALDTPVVGIRAAHRRGATPAAGIAPTLRSTVVAPLPRRALYDAWNTVRLPRAEHLVAGAEVVHATTWAVPPTRRPLVVTVHDVAFLRSPEHFSARGNKFFARSLQRTIDEAAVVVVPSAATRDDCVDAGIDADRIAVVPHGVSVPVISSADVDAFRRRHGIDGPYVLWCGTLEPRKNVPAMVDAFVRAELPPEVRLVLAGPQGWGDVAVAAHPGRVRTVGRLSEHDLHCAYAGAAAFCFPSSWEGFGMPVLEAMAHGVPVVTSAKTSMAEFAAGAGVLVDPGDVDDIARGLRAALGPEARAWGTAGRATASTYTWERAARETFDTFARAGLPGPLR
ncbi:glycosyltransferase family 4 protein [Cellulomonas sp. URHB0016]